jgi:serine/threonine protein kinase
MWQAGHSPVPGYKLEKFLGKGNFGEVWQSTSPGGTKCALKFLNLRERQGRKELRAIQKLKQIRHANIMPINAMWLLDDQQQIIPDNQFEPSHPFMEDTSRQTLVSLPQIPEEEKPKTLVIAMPLAEGNLLELLTSRQKQGKDIPVEELLVYMMDAARALDYLNAQCHEYQGQIVSVQHGDVKPENLVLLGGSVMLCDFGVARILGSGTDTRGTSLGGSLAYMAPECMAGETSQHSDQFSLAIGYAELRTGHLPFADESITRVIEDRRTGQLDLEGLTAAEQRIIRRACSVAPEKRFGSNVEFVEALRAAMSESGSRPKKFHWLIPASLLLGLVSIGVLMWKLAPIESPPPPVPPKEKTGREYFAEAMDILKQPNVSADQLAEATEKYGLALEAAFPADVPEPASLRVPDNTTSPIYQHSQLIDSHLVATHPLTGRIVIVGPNGRTLLEPGNGTTKDQTYELSQTSPIISVRWLNDSQLLVCDSNWDLRRIDLTSPDSNKLAPIAFGVWQTATSPQAGVGLAASDIDSGIIYRIDSQRVMQASHRMTTPLLDLDEDGVWGVTLERGEAPGTVRLLSIAASSANNSELTIVKEVDTQLEPYCVACMRIGKSCFAIVGGKGDSTQNRGGLAIIPFPDINGSFPPKPIEVFVPTSQLDKEPFQDNGRAIRSLATHYSTEQKLGLLATGQDNGSFTELWHINSDGTTISQGLVGQETKSTSISALAFDPAGKWLVRGTEYGEIRLTQLSQPKLDFSLLADDYDAEVLQLQIVDGKLVATFEDASVLVWNFFECQMVYEACLHQGRELPQPKFKRPHSG